MWLYEVTFVDSAVFICVSGGDAVWADLLLPGRWSALLTLFTSEEWHSEK